MKKVSMLVIAAVVVITAVCGLATTAMASPGGVEIVVTTSGVTTTISSPGCLNYDGAFRSFEIVARHGYWVSNGYDAGWVTLVSNGVGDYSLTRWGALHVCGGSTVDEAIAALAAIDQSGANNPRRVVNPSTSTSTATVTVTRTSTSTHTPTPAPTKTSAPTSTRVTTATPTSTPTTQSPPVSYQSVFLQVTSGRLGSTQAITSPGCLNFNLLTDGLLTKVTDFSGHWVANGREAVLCATSVGCFPSSWETIWGGNEGIYNLGFEAFHVCGGYSLDEAIEELRAVDPGAAENPLRRITPAKELERVFLPLFYK